MDRTPLRPSFALPTPARGKTGRGFTLIEILIVVVVLGILAAVAIPHFSRAKEKAHVAAMVTDLHAAAIFEEEYAAEHSGTYFSGTVSAATPHEDFRTSEDVVVTLSVRAAPALGPLGVTWTGVARHKRTDKSCESKHGVIACTNRNTVSAGEIAEP